MATKYRFLFILIPMIATLAMAQNAGKASHSLYGGNKGRVEFPHHQHQTQLGDCGICHTSFPQESGSLEALKAKGKLKKKQIMNKTCMACHRRLKKAGKSTGPTRCNGCHTR